MMRCCYVKECLINGVDLRIRCELGIYLCQLPAGMGIFFIITCNKDEMRACLLCLINIHPCLYAESSRLIGCCCYNSPCARAGNSYWFSSEMRIGLLLNRGTK